MRWQKITLPASFVGNTWAPARVYSKRNCHDVDSTQIATTDCSEAKRLEIVNNMVCQNERRRTRADEITARRLQDSRRGKQIVES